MGAILNLLPEKTTGKLVLVIAILVVFLIASVARVRNLQTQLAAKPITQDRIVTRTVTGPTRIEIRTITKPGGEVIVERIQTVESKVEETGKAHEEIPVAIPRTRYVGLGIDPARWSALPRLRAGVTVWGGAVDLGASYDSRFSPTGGAFGLEGAYRF